MRKFRRSTRLAAVVGDHLQYILNNRTATYIVGEFGGGMCTTYNEALRAIKEAREIIRQHDDYDGGSARFANNERIRDNKALNELVRKMKADHEKLKTRGSTSGATPVCFVANRTTWDSEDSTPESPDDLEEDDFRSKKEYKAARKELTKKWDLWDANYDDSRAYYSDDNEKLNQRLMRQTTVIHETFHASMMRLRQKYNLTRLEGGQAMYDLLMREYPFIKPTLKLSAKSWGAAVNAAEEVLARVAQLHKACHGKKVKDVTCRMNRTLLFNATLTDHLEVLTEAITKKYGSPQAFAAKAMQLAAKQR